MEPGLTVQFAGFGADAVLRKHAIPAIINTSAGGLMRMADAPEHVCFVDSIPYEWIFPKVQSVVHHGGAGTTHTAIKHGCPSLIFPHIIDQFFWNRRVADLGVGPLGVKIKRLNAPVFERLLLDVRKNAKYAATAQNLRRQMSAEAPRDALLEALVQ